MFKSSALFATVASAADSVVNYTGTIADMLDGFTSAV